MKKFSILLISLLFYSSVYAIETNRCLSFMDKRIVNDTLMLASCHLQDQDMNMIVKFLKENQRVKSLNLNDNNLGDDAAISLSKSTSLIEISLNKNHISSIGADSLAHHPSLRKLWLNGNKIGDNGAVAIAQNKNLELLDVSANMISNTGATAIAAIPALKSLMIGCNRLNEISAASLARSTTIENLNITLNPIGDDGAAMLLKNEHLKTIEMSRVTIQDKALTAIANNKTLQTITLDIGDEARPYISKLISNTSIKDLTILGYFDNKSAKLLAGMKNLESLNIEGFITPRSTLDAKGAAQLALLPKLHTLVLTQITLDEDAAKVIANSNIENLVVQDISDAGMIELAKSKKLKSLSVTRSFVLTSYGLNAIAKNKNLESLDVRSVMQFKMDRTTAESFAANNNLHSLKLWYVNMPNSVLKIFSKLIVPNVSLITDSFNDNNVQTLVENNSIRNLFINSNVPEDKTAYLFAKNTTLESLDITFKKLSLNAQNALEQNKHIVYLDIFAWH